MADEIVKWPFGDLETIALTATGTQALQIKNGLTVVDGVTVEATGNRTLNLTFDDQLEAGAMLLVKSKTNATETTIFGTGITAPTITGVAGKTHTQMFMYDGTAFVAVGADQQID